MKQTTVRFQVNDIRSQADFLQGKVSEYETLLLSYAEEKAYLITEIERLRYTLNCENTSTEFEKVKGELYKGRVEIVNEANRELGAITNERMQEGMGLRGEMQDKVAHQNNKKVTVSAQVSKLNHAEIPRIKKDRVDIEDDIQRFTLLSQRYADLDREFLKCTDEFEKAQNQRKDRRVESLNIRSKVNTHLDEHETSEVNFAEVENLCQMIDAKDKTLMEDLLKLKDLLNQRKLDKEGFKPDGTTVSSIMVNEIVNTEMDLLKREKASLERQIDQDQKELEKITKLVEKYKDDMERQSR